MSKLVLLVALLSLSACATAGRDDSLTRPGNSAQLMMGEAGSLSL